MTRKSFLIVALLIAALFVSGCQLFGASTAEATKTAQDLSKLRAATPVVITNTVTIASTTQVTTTTPITTTAPLAPANTPTPKPVAACQAIPDYDKPPQPQIGHPSFYIETGIESTRCWVVTVKPGFIAVIGGYTVDGQSSGVYKALAAGTYTVTVTNGFLAIPVNEVARDEFCFRVGQAEQYKWAHSNVFPLANWSDCSVTATQKAVTSASITANTNNRKATGKGASLTFQKGDAVAGFEITLNDGRSCNQCYVEKAPLGGVITDGVIWPWPEEVTGLAKPDWK